MDMQRAPFSICRVGKRRKGERLIMDVDILNFFDRNMDALPLYEAFESSVRKEITDVRIKVGLMMN